MTHIDSPAAGGSGEGWHPLPVHPAAPPIAPPPAARAPFRLPLPIRNRWSFWTVAGLLFLVAAVGIFIKFRRTPAGTMMELTFVSIILEALPFVMLGSLLGGFFEVFVPRKWVVRLLPERKLYAILVAAGLGLLLPVCECAVIPFTRRLVRKGMPFSTAVAYLLAGPIVNLLVASATLMAYGWNWPVLAARLFFGYVVAVTVALLVDRFFPGQSALIASALDQPAAPDCGHDHDGGHDDEPTHEHPHDHDHGPSQSEPRPPLWNRLAEAVNHAGDDFLQVGQFLVIGAFIASICKTLIPNQAFLTVTHAPILAIMIMMGMAVVLNLCSGADAFVAASFRNALPLSAQMGFMVLGPMLDLKLSAMYLSFIKKRAFITMVVLMYSTVLICMIVYQLFTGGR